MDERKRERSFRDDKEEPKRFRPEEILGNMDNGKVITRLLVNKDEFSRLIGKGGAFLPFITDCLYKLNLIVLLIFKNYRLRI